MSMRQVQRTTRRRPAGELQSSARQRNAWEQQAEEAGARFSKQKQMSANWLTPATPASYRLPGSVANPLPKNLRTDLEQSFRADLSAIRIHRDAQSTAAVREENAVAFAAGRDIFMDEGAAPLDSVAGRELLAHEVAHVLQQTGRAGSDGRVKATDASGSGEVQRKGEGSKLRRAVQLDFDKLAASHRDEAEDPNKFDDLVAVVRDALDGTLDETTKNAADFEASVLRKDPKIWTPVTQSEAAAGFVFDVLKFTDRFAGAGVVLQQSLLLQTYVPLHEMALYYTGNVDKGGDYFDKIAGQHPLLSHFWPNRYFDTHTVFLFGPTRAVPTLTDQQGKTYADALKEYLADQDKQSLDDNEVVLGETRDLADFDKCRVKTMTLLQAEVGKALDPEMAPVAFRAALAFKMREWAREAQKDPKAIVQKIGAKIEAIAQAAIDYWNAVFDAEFSFDFETAKAKPNDQNVKTKRRAIPLEKIFTEEIPDALVAAAAIFSKTTAMGELPAPAVYAAQVKSAMSGLKNFVRDRLELQLIALARRGSTQDDFSVALGWFLLWFQQYFKLGSEYDAAKDKDFGAKFQGYPDVRFSHRLHLARRISALVVQLAAGSVTHWQTLQKQITDVLANKSEGRSRLSILGTWKAQSGAPIGQIATDFEKGFRDDKAGEHEEGPQSPIRLLTAAELSNLYLLLYFRDLTGELQVQMAGADQDFKDPRAALQKKSLLNQAVDDVDARSRPVRYVVGEWDYADNPNESQDLGGTDPIERANVFSELVQSHPKTAKLEAEENAKGRQVLYAKSPYSADSNELFLWSIPDLALVFGTLRTLGPLNALIAKFSGMALDDVARLSDDAWIGALSQVVEARAAIDSALSAVLMQARADLNVALRNAVTHERKLLVAAMKAVLPQYTGLADQTWELPSEILARIESLANWVVPKEDQQAQVTALILAIAPELSEALQKQKRFDIITSYYGYLILAFAGSEGAQLNDLARVVPDQAERDQLLANRASLEELKKYFDEQRASVQNRFGFQSEDGKVLTSLIYGEEIKPRVPFKLNGYKYELQQVYRKFHYNPPYGFEGTPAYRPPMMDGKAYGTEYKPTGAKLFTILQDGRKYDITDSDTGWLNEYSNIIEQEANIIGLLETAAAIQAFTELTLDAVELVPGVGQGVAAARVIATFVEFLASGEWDDIKNLLTNDPKALLERIWEKLKEVLSPENLWIYLLFGSPLFDWLESKINNPRHERVAQRTEPTSTLGKLVAKVRGIETGLAHAWEWLEGHVQLPLKTFQAFVLSHPILALVLDLVADNLHRLVDLKTWLGDHDKEAGFTDTISSVQDVFKLEMEELVGSLQHLELPARVVPTEKIIDAVIELILSRLGTKGKLTKLVLGKLGVLDRISRLIDDEVVAGSPADPNKYWREDVIPLIEEKFNAVRDGLVADIYEVLVDRLGLPMERPAVGEKKKIATPAGDGFPEADPFLDDEVPLSRSMHLPQPGAGMPLPSVMRGSAERRFGHDFSHVRLHTGTEAASVTGSFGAAGLTTGSHVYMNPAVPLTSPHGRQVFDHELTHVLQQTGPRPLGMEHNSSPSTGREGGGLRYDPAQESAADRVAHTVGTRSGGGPVDPGPLRGGGYQPAFLSIKTVRRFLHQLTDVEKAKQAQREIDREALRGGKPVIDDDQVAIGEGIWKDVREKISSGKLPSSSPNLEDVRSDFMSYFDGIASDVGRVVPQIAFGYSEPVKEKGEGEGPPLVKRKLKPKQFVGGLEDYMLAKAGVLTSIKLDKSGAVESVQIKNVLLEMVGSGSRLWTLAMSNAGITASEFEELRPLLRSKLRELNTETTYIDVKANGLPALMFVWESSKFAFHSRFVAEVKEQAALSKIKDRPHDLPKYSQYIDHKDKSGGKLGVRVGKYGDSNHRGIPDRESHHTTQFLLIEYFRNKSDNQPFPPALKKDFSALGIAYSGKETTRFKPLLEPNVEFEKLDVGTRGEAMPSILISRPTHRGANLHVSGAAAEDFPDGGIPVTQGEKVHSTFLTKLKAAGATKIADAIPDNSAKLQEHVATVGNTVASTQIYKAMQDTYGWMHNHMLPALNKALRTNERDYYEDIVIAKHTQNKGKPDEKLDPDYDLQPDQMELVYSAAEENNDKVLRAMGWIEP